MNKTNNKLLLIIFLLILCPEINFPQEKKDNNYLLDVSKYYHLTTMIEQNNLDRIGQLYSFNLALNDLFHSIDTSILVNEIFNKNPIIFYHSKCLIKHADIYFQDINFAISYGVFNEIKLINESNLVDYINENKIIKTQNDFNTAIPLLNSVFCGNDAVILQDSNKTLFDYFLKYEKKGFRVNQLEILDKNTFNYRQIYLIKHFEKWEYYIITYTYESNKLKVFKDLAYKMHE